LIPATRSPSQPPINGTLWVVGRGSGQPGDSNKN